MLSHAARQRVLKNQLRCALAESDERNCWARVEKNDKSADIMKLLAVNGNYYSFLSEGRKFDTLKADCWLVHEDEFYVHWVGEGLNRAGSKLTGEELETGFFMYYDDFNEEADEYPEVVELEDAPEGMACEDVDGKTIQIGDTVKITSTERTFIVDMISYHGFEDRSQAEVWSEPGYMLDDTEGTGYVHASACRVVADNEEAADETV